MNQEFYVTMNFKSQNEIEIVDCNPTLNAIHDLAQQLSQRQIKLPQFVIIVRQQFKKLYCRPSGRFGIA